MNYESIYTLLENYPAWQIAGLTLMSGLVIGIICTALYLRSKYANRVKQAAQSAFIEGREEVSYQLGELHEAQMTGMQTQLRNAELSLGESRAAHDVEKKLLAQNLQQIQLQLDQSRREISELREKLDNSQIQATISQTQLSELQQNFAEKEQFFKETSEQLKTEFESLATKVLEKREQQQQQSLHNVLNPFKEQIVDFKKRVEEVYHTETKERSSLLTEIKILQTASEKINNEAQNLTRALKGDKKLQGNWGELVLERVLENSGLRRDHEYKVQNSYRTSEGELKRPDVVIRLPDGKDVVVDSKVSLNDYERALSCDDDHSRERFLRNFIGHLRNHVRGLSSQNYDQLPDVRSLDFVLLFIPIESAFTLAMESDQNLFNEAFGKRIVIVSPTTLMMTLRIINNVWRYEKQNRNAQEIAQKAGALYDKLRGLVEDMDKLGKQLHTARGTYEAVYGKLTSGKGNLVGQVEKFRQLGAVVKYPMPEKLLDGAEGDLDH